MNLDFMALHEAFRNPKQVHIFPEGYVNQPNAPHGSHHALLRFRWGISRLLLESSPDVHVLPIYIRGGLPRRYGLRKLTFSRF